MHRPSLATFIGLGISIVGLAVTVGGFGPYPAMGIVLLVVGVVVAIWPLIATRHRCLEEIRFDYIAGSPSGSPLAEGWTVAYGDDPTRPPDFDVSPDPQGRYGLEMQAHPGYAIRYMLSRASAAATQRLRLSIRYSDTTMFFVLVQLASPDGARTVNRQLKIELQGNNPRAPEQHPDVHSEKIAWVRSQPLGEGWVALDLRVANLVGAAWGKEDGSTM